MTSTRNTTVAESEIAKYRAQKEQNQQATIEEAEHAPGVIGVLDLLPQLQAFFAHLDDRTRFIMGASADFGVGDSYDDIEAITDLWDSVVNDADFLIEKAQEFESDPVLGPLAKAYLLVRPADDEDDDEEDLDAQEASSTAAEAARIIEGDKQATQAGLAKLTDRERFIWAAANRCQWNSVEPLSGALGDLAGSDDIAALAERFKDDVNIGWLAWTMLLSGRLCRK